MKKKHFKVYIVITIFILIIGISIAYATLSQTLKVNSTTTIQSSQTSWNIIITKNYCYGKENRSVPGSGTYRDVQGYKVDIQGTAVKVSNAIIRAPGDTFGCKFYIENKGEVDAKVQSVFGPTTTFSGTGTSADADVNLVKQYMICADGKWLHEWKDIESGDLLKAGEKKEIEVAFCFSLEMPTLPTNPVTFSSTFSINFEQA